MEQRQETRIGSSFRFFVHVHDSDDDPDMIGTSLTCEAVDFSAHGLQFSTNSELASGTLLNLTIGFEDPFAMYLLRGEVRWARENDDRFYMGVLLIPEDGTDLDRWLKTFD